MTIGTGTSRWGSRQSCILSGLLLLWSVSPSFAEENWPSFLNGGSSQIRADGVPTSWSPEKNIAWRARIPGYGQSAPVIWDGSIYVTSSDGPWQERGFVHAFDLATGKKRWTKAVPASTKVQNYFRNSRAAPTCVVDKAMVVSFFPTGDITAMDHSGKVLWTMPLFEKFGQPKNERGTASSLAQSRDNVFAVIDHDGPSYAVALRKADGKIAWKADRGKRVPSWTSPVLTRQGKNDLLIVSSSDTVDAYKADTGKRVWQVDGLQGNHIPSATVVGHSLFVGSTRMFHSKADPRKVAASNCRIDLTHDSGDKSYEVRWGAERANSYYSSPLALAGFVYYVNKTGILYCCDAETGKRLFNERIGSPCWASGTGVTTSSGVSLAYFFMKNGTTLVLRPGKKFDPVAKNTLWDEKQLQEAAKIAKKQRDANKVPPEEAPKQEGPEKLLSGLPEANLHKFFSYGDPIVYGTAVVDGRLVIRTGQQLYCIGQD